MTSPWGKESVRLERYSPTRVEAPLRVCGGGKHIETLSLYLLFNITKAPLKQKVYFQWQQQQQKRCLSRAHIVPSRTWSGHLRPQNSLPLPSVGLSLFPEPAATSFLGLSSQGQAALQVCPSNPKHGQGRWRLNDFLECLCPCKVWTLGEKGEVTDQLSPQNQFSL